MREGGMPGEFCGAWPLLVRWSNTAIDQFSKMRVHAFEELDVALGKKSQPFRFAGEKSGARGAESVGVLEHVPKEGRKVEGIILILKLIINWLSKEQFKKNDAERPDVIRLRREFRVRAGSYKLWGHVPLWAKIDDEHGKRTTVG